jgi:glycosyltransferase involved in cell wall biosynthesis
LKTKTDFIYLVGDLGYGGQERQLFYLVSALREKGYYPAVVPWNYQPTDPYFHLLTEKKVDIIRLSQKSTLNRILELRRFIRHTGARVIHSFSFHLNPVAALAALGNTCHAIGGIRNRLNLYQKDMSYIHFLACCFLPRIQISNNYDYANGSTLKGIHHKLVKTFVITNALDIKNFTASIPVEDNLFRTISVGRLFREKRIDVVIDVVATLKKSGIPIRHEHAGEGVLKDSLQEKIRSLNIENEFILVGNKSDINTFMQPADLFIHSSEYEGYPNVIMEAMACGKPVVSSDCGDTKYLIENGVNGYVVSVNSSEALSEYISKLYHDRSLIQRIAVQNRNDANVRFSIDAYIQKTLNTYTKLT